MNFSHAEQHNEHTFVLNTRTHQNPTTTKQIPTQESVHPGTKHFHMSSLQILQIWHKSLHSIRHLCPNHIHVQLICVQLPHC